ncbi:methionyl-tRNA formyltransferase [Candidatus Kuenenbacteria bacterium RIFCSPHIGHO2_12_FULL_42_14]|uniref:Methionyl-tRNA formyltransferase n=1 Tax=Candidatus Kuenenbacteria bacterium RIFCSPHIGHO2_12_FULL_42_14 TaxID=1798563 RepID=A0A1F6GMC6_9BACT|nr:MAG: methionyl-tRNA formyltransferase [Candidatus Kuenenbacteria bacterium RIFCSPHIGHO2_12_FULL_42_14]
MSNNNPSLVFFGTSDFAATILSALLDSTEFKSSVASVVTRPDEPIGRKHVITPPPVKLLAVKHHLPVLQPEKLDQNFIHQLKKINADIFIVADYGQIIPTAILNLPKYKPLNIHISLLPKYRGASPMQTALLNGDRETGISIIELMPLLDQGPIIAQQIVSINPDDNHATLRLRMAGLSAALLQKILPDFIQGKITPVSQDDSRATYTALINKKDGLIPVNKTAEETYNMWRAYTPWPGIFLTDGLKLLNTERTDLTSQTNAPLTLFVQNQNLFLQCANGTCLKINLLQPPGKKPMDARSFINGYLK